MLKGKARRRKSGIFFNVVKNIVKYRTKDIEDVTPEILLSQASISTVEDYNTNPNLTARSARTHTTDTIDIKLNRLCAMLAQFKSHKDFPSRCIQEKLIQKGLELNLEPTIGNYDQEFIDNWYSNLKYFSLILVKQIVTYCKKTEKKTQSISEIEATLKGHYAEILDTITINETVTKEILYQQKLKKFNTFQ